MRRWWNEKDYIGFIPEKMITEKMSFEETVEMIISDVQTADRRSVQYDLKN